MFYVSERKVVIIMGFRKLLRLQEKLAFGQFLFNSLEVGDCLLAVENLVVGFRI